MKNQDFPACPVSSPPLGEVRLKGRLGELTDRVIARRINSRYARETVVREAIDAFRNKVDDASGVIGIWQGEYWGKWMIGAVRAAEYTGSGELRGFIRDSVYELLSLRDEHGCISTYRDPAWFTAAPEEEVIKVLGEPSDWNWNIWCRKYTLWGILEAWRLLREQPILDAAAALTDDLMETLEKNHTDLRKTGTFQGLASCSILKPVLLLYRFTGEERFLNFAKTIVDALSSPDGAAPNLIANALSGRPVHRWYDDLGHWTKAYEMMSCVDGLLLFCRLTGRREILPAMEKLYELLTAHETNRMGSVGFNDQFQHAGIYLDSISEPCDAIHWMRMCFGLFELTGNVRYMDSFELTCLNAFPAGIFRDGSWGMRAVRSSGHHMTAPEQAKMHHNHCCVNNMPRGLFNIAESCLMREGDRLIVNHFIPFAGRCAMPGGDTAAVTVSGDYPASCAAVIDVSCPGAVTLKLRVPGWTSSARITHPGGTFRALPGFAEVPLPAGGGRITVAFDPAVRLEEFPVSGEPEELPAWHRKRYREGARGDALPLTRGRRALLRRGPLLLARSKLIGDSAENMFGTPSVAGGGYVPSLKRIDLPETLAAFDAEFIAPDGSVRRERVCDFASAANIDSTDAELFTMFF